MKMRRARPTPATMAVDADERPACHSSMPSTGTRARSASCPSAADSPGRETGPA